MQTERWRELRRLFDAACDLPPQRWRATLAGLSEDPALIEEALQLLGAQTDELGAVARPLQALLADASGSDQDPNQASAEPRAGDRLGAWLLVERVGSGGMGTVFVAERADGLFRQQAAIKLLRSDGRYRTGIDRDEFARRLAAERQLLAELQHPNIARLYDGGTTPCGQPYLVMEYVQGEPLDDYCERCRPGLEQRLRLFQRICGAVQSAHQRLIVHCDLKPANVLVAEDGEPVLLDFGIAQALDRRHGDPERGNAFCTPAYASPELLGGARVSVVGDVFALGVLLTELLACRTLGRSVADRERTVPAPSALATAQCPWRGKLRGDLDAIAQRACALDPHLRYSSVEALAQDLIRYQRRRPVSARAPSWSYRLGRYLRRHWREAAATAAVLTLAIGFVWRVSAERARAEREAAVAEQVGEFLISAFDAADPSMRGARARQDVSARQVLDASAARIEHGLDRTPAIRARLRAVLGRAYRNLGQPQQAEALLDRAAREFLDPAVAQPERAAQALLHLSRSLSERQYGARAVAAAQRALALRQAQGEARGLAEAYDALGLARVAASRYDLAEVAFARSQALRRKHALRQSPQERAAMLGDLGQLYRRRGELARAEAAFREALELARADGAHSVAAQVQQFYLAKVLFGQGRLAETRRELADNLGLARDLYGEQSDMVANIHVDIADAAQDMGDYRIAADHYRVALAIMAKAAGTRSLDYARVLHNTATLADERGDVGEAERLWREALSIRREHLDPLERRVLRVESYLGRLLARTGRGEEARPLVERAAAVWRERYGDDRVGVLTAELVRIEWLLSRDRLDQAAAALDAIDLGRGEYNAFLLARIPALRAELAQRRGERERAVSGWAQVVAESARRHGQAQIPTAKARVAYAESLLARGDRTAARAQFEAAAPLLRRELHRDAPLLLRVDALERAVAGAGLAAR